MSEAGLDIQVELTEDLLVSFLRREAGKFGFSRGVVGLSGGVDSAVTAALAARAFGPGEVLAVNMPYRTSDPASAADAEAVAGALGLCTRTVDISAMADGYLAEGEIADRGRRGNVMARCRMIVLYDLSVEWNGLVIGTSNKTELLFGYSTQFGDSASALNPIGDLYKHQIYQLARHLELPAAVREKAPSADLFEGQTDEQELGFTYEEADRLLYLLVDERHDAAELIARGFDAGLVEAVVRKVTDSQYKRLPPVVAKISDRTVNQDFRYLRSWGR
ncbi:MAG: NAD+ synthase [Planctomycetota bacterium]|nr:NAD+ synthase [Planctomycetota bacterium]MDP6762741.1 NAD+ synthase [Planctomycetota bacterium]MDP6988533.1 NAD+ synthase [Planctomycetota bacterium]